MNWGKLALTPAETVTVTGTADSQERNQIASFSAGVTSVNDNRDTAVNEVNTKTETIIAAVKDFGIPEADIQTQNLSINQNEEVFYSEGAQRSRPGQWRANNSIEVTLRDIDRASALADLLTKSGATNVYGPNFRTQDTDQAENALLEEAIEAARTKADIIAGAAGKTLGEIITVTEGTGSQPILPFESRGMGGGGAPVEPGTTTVSKTVTVIFELK